LINSYCRVGPVLQDVFNMYQQWIDICNLSSLCSEAYTLPTPMTLE